jgi:hypothetical protein
MVVLGEERLDGLVQGRKKKVLIVEPGERPAPAGAEPWDSVWRWEQLVAAQTVICAETVDRIVRSRSQQLQRPDERAREVVDIGQKHLPSPGS